MQQKLNKKTLRICSINSHANETQIQSRDIQTLLKWFMKSKNTKTAPSGADVRETHAHYCSAEAV